jgi:hypothetical protein
VEALRRLATLIALGLAFLASGCARDLSYDRPELSIRGDDNRERVRSIASVVHREFSDTLAVPTGEMVTDDEGTHAQYLVLVTVPHDTFFRSPSNPRRLQAQQRAYAQLNSAIAALMRLSMKYLVPQDTSITSIIVLLVLPNSEVWQVEGQVDQLKDIPPDASTEQWLERVSLDRQVIVPESVLQEILGALNWGAEGVTPIPRR